MSLESYLKTLESQRERELELGIPTKNHSASVETPRHVDQQSVGIHTYQPAAQSKPKSKRTTLYVLIGLALFLGVLTNPSKSEAKSEIRTVVMEKYNEHMRNMLMDEGSSSTEQFGASLGLLFGSAIVDNLVEIEVANYVAFSTFEVYSTYGGGHHFIADGMIVFGQIIPFNTKF